MMIGGVKGRLAQGFLHIYRGKRYSFLLVNMIESYFVKDDS